MINDDIKYYYSGGTSGVAATSLGGIRSNTEVVTSVDENLFLNIDSADAEAGTTHYRCLYLRNEGTVGYDVEIYIAYSTPSSGTSIYIGVGTAAIDNNEPTIANEDTEPSGVIWQQRNFDYNATVVATLLANEHKSIWFKRVTLADTGGSLKDYFRVTLTGLSDEAPGSDPLPITGVMDFSSADNSAMIIFI